jgi:hypothetical protein
LGADDYDGGGYGFIDVAGIQSGQERRFYRHSADYGRRDHRIRYRHSTRYGQYRAADDHYPQ